MPNNLYKEATYVIFGNVPNQQLDTCNDISNLFAVTGDEAFILINTVEDEYLGYCIERLEKTRNIKKVLHEYFTELYGK